MQGEAEEAEAGWNKWVNQAHLWTHLHISCSAISLYAYMVYSRKKAIPFNGGSIIVVSHCEHVMSHDES